MVSLSEKSRTARKSSSSFLRELGMIDISGSRPVKKRAASFKFTSRPKAEISGFAEHATGTVLPTTGADIRRTRELAESTAGSMTNAGIEKTAAISAKHVSVTSDAVADFAVNDAELALSPAS